MKKIIMLSVLFLGIVFLSCEKETTIQSPDPQVGTAKNIVPDVMQRLKQYKVYCPKSGCGYSQNWTPGCTYEDPYNAFIACPWCYYQWLKHSSESGVCNH